MTSITLTSEITVTVLQDEHGNAVQMGSDAVCAMAARTSNLGRRILEDDPEGVSGLIRYLLKHRHASPFRHGGISLVIHAPVFVTRQMIRHHVGVDWCLPGSAMIPVGQGLNGRKRSIAEIYRNWKEGIPDTMGRVRQLDSCKHLWTRTVNLDTGFVEFVRMVDVRQSGVKSIIRITTNKGKVLRCTREHRVYTHSGWIQAGDLAIGSMLGVQGKVPTGKYEGVPKSLRRGIQDWTANIKRELVHPIDTCYVCGGEFAYDDLQMDHMIPVADDLTKALDISNLKPICYECHQAKTGREALRYLGRRRAVVAGMRWEYVTAIADDGAEMTYDISMPGPWHNFIADEFVVHNSEESARYKTLDPVFWHPRTDRPIQPATDHKPARPTFVQGTDTQITLARMKSHASYGTAYQAYEDELAAGIAGEVARRHLPVAIYSTLVMTANPNALMNFLALRTFNPDPEAPERSYPQSEIAEVADLVEAQFAHYWPLTHQWWVRFGRKHL